MGNAVQKYLHIAAKIRSDAQMHCCILLHSLARSQEVILTEAKPAVGSAHQRLETSVTKQALETELETQNRTQRAIGRREGGKEHTIC